MFEVDFADMCAGKFLLMSSRGSSVCGTGSEDPHPFERKFWLLRDTLQTALQPYNNSRKPGIINLI